MMTRDNQLIADAKEAGFDIEDDEIYVNCDYQAFWEVTEDIKDFAAIRDKRKDSEIARLREAAQAVVDRWDSPLWKDQPHTADFIHALREAIAKEKG